MAYVTGKDLTLTIDGDSYAAQASSVVLTTENNRFTGDVIGGKFRQTVDFTATLQVDFYADWGSVGSFAEALWNATKNAPDTALAFSFDANGATWTGTAYPEFPAAGGSATDVLSTSVTLTVVESGLALA